MFEKAIGKLLTKLAIVYICKEAKRAVTFGVVAGLVRLNNIIDKDSVEKGLRIMDLMDRQKLIFLGKRQLLAIYEGRLDDARAAPVAHPGSGPSAPPYCRGNWCFLPKLVCVLITASDMQSVKLPLSLKVSGTFLVF
jgi:hypothetical protein